MHGHFAAPSSADIVWSPLTRRHRVRRTFRETQAIFSSRQRMDRNAPFFASVLSDMMDLGTRTFGTSYRSDTFQSTFERTMHARTAGGRICVHAQFAINIDQHQR